MKIQRKFLALTDEWERLVEDVSSQVAKAVHQQRIELREKRRADRELLQQRHKKALKLQATQTQTVQKEFNRSIKTIQNLWGRGLVDMEYLVNQQKQHRLKMEQFHIKELQTAEREIDRMLSASMPAGQRICKVFEEITFKDSRSENCSGIEDISLLEKNNQNRTFNSLLDLSCLSDVSELFNKVIDEETAQNQPVKSHLHINTGVDSDTSINIGDTSPVDEESIQITKEDVKHALHVLSKGNLLGSPQHIERLESVLNDTDSSQNLELLLQISSINSARNRDADSSSKAFTPRERCLPRPHVFHRR